LANHSRNLDDIKTLQRRNNGHLIGSKVEWQHLKMPNVWGAHLSAKFRGQTQVPTTNQYLQYNVWWNSPKKWCTRDRLLHQNSAPTHTVLCRNFWSIMAWLVSCPIHTPQIVPCDFCLLPKLKLALKWRRFQDIYMIEEQSYTTLPELWTENINKFFQQWCNCWNSFIN
jgi:hypothetical protein